MKAVILFGHGSRVKGSESDMEKVAAAVGQRLGGAVVATCYISLTPPTFEEALDDCVTRGATDVVVVPYMLSKGAHVQKDLPEMIAAGAQKYPGVTIVYSDYLGFDDLMVELVLKKIEKAEKD